MLEFFLQENTKCIRVLKQKNECHKHKKISTIQEITISIKKTA